MYYEDHLAHHGIKGQKWGVRRTPEQLGHKPKKSSAQKARNAAKKTAKAVSKTAANTKVKLKDLKDKRDGAKRERMLKAIRKNPQKLYSNRTKLTKEDAEKLIAQINTDKKLKDIRTASRKEKYRHGMETLKTLSNDMNTVSSLLGNSINTWNNVAYIHNALIDAGKMNGKKMQVISRGGGNPEKKKPDSD